MRTSSIPMPRTRIREVGTIDPVAVTEQIPGRVSYGKELPRSAGLSSAPSDELVTLK